MRAVIVTGPCAQGCGDSDRQGLHEIELRLHELTEAPITDAVASKGSFAAHLAVAPGADHFHRVVKFRSLQFRYLNANRVAPAT